MKSVRHQEMLVRGMRSISAWNLGQKRVDELLEDLSQLLELAYTLGKKDQASKDLDTAKKLREEAS